MSGDRPGWDQAIEAAAAYLRGTHWDGTGCGTNGSGACSRCYGPSPADVGEVSEDAIAAAYPVIVAAVRQHIAAEIDDEADSLPRYWDGAIECLRRAAHIARGES